jgi:hypothetical protein
LATVVALAIVTVAKASPTLLFNGKDLSGWSTYVQGEGKDHDATHIFQVDDGTIHLYKDASAAKPAVGYIATTQEYSNYRLRFQYKWGDAKSGAKRNSGLLYHIRGDDAARGSIVWPYCIQCQVQEGNTGEIVALGTAVTTTVADASAKSPVYKSADAGGVAYSSPRDVKASSKIARSENAETDGWNTVEVEVRGDAAVHIVNGKPVARYTAAVAPDSDGSWTPLTKGRIGFQAEGCEISYRNIELEPLDQSWQPLFNGRDLGGFYTYLKNLGKNNDPGKVFQVHDGIIHIYKDAEQGSEQPFGYICTEKEYGDCRVRFDYKWGEKRFGSRATKRRDSGCLYFVFGEDGKGIGVWPFSIECQIQEQDVGDTFAIGSSVSATVDSETAATKNPVFKESGEGGVRYTSPLTGNNRIVRSKMLEKDGWNTVEIVLEGDSAVHIVNGTVNMRLSKCTRPDANDPTKRAKLDRGRILFQAEGAEVMYRNIEIQPLARGGGEARAQH